MRWSLTAGGYCICPVHVRLIVAVDHFLLDVPASPGTTTAGSKCRDSAHQLEGLNSRLQYLPPLPVWPRPGKLICSWILVSPRTSSTLPLSVPLSCSRCFSDKAFSISVAKSAILYLSFSLSLFRSRFKTHLSPFLWLDRLEIFFTVLWGSCSTMEKRVVSGAVYYRMKQRSEWRYIFTFLSPLSDWFLHYVQPKLNSRSCCNFFIYT